MSDPQNFLHELVGSMSQGAAGNPTVAMIEAAFAHHGLHWRYINLEVGSLKPGMVVADVIGNPPRTRLIRDAAERGCMAFDGLGMLVNQGIVGVQYWTGMEPDASVMRRALEQALGLDL